MARSLTLLSVCCLFLWTMAVQGIIEPFRITPDGHGVTSVELTVDVARIDIPGAVAFNSRAYHYQGSPVWPGPTLVVRPGGTLRVKIINNLGAEHPMATPGSAMMHNRFGHLNTTNLHTHGLHIDPKRDSVFIQILPEGGEFQYELPIPADHAPGTHWYHAHVHGSTTLQVMSGLFGVLLVEPIPGQQTAPSEIDAYQEHVIAVHRLRFVSDGVPSCHSDMMNMGGGMGGMNMTSPTMNMSGMDGMNSTSPPPPMKMNNSTMTMNGTSSPTPMPPMMMHASHSKTFTLDEITKEAGYSGPWTSPDFHTTVAPMPMPMKRQHAGMNGTMNIPGQQQNFWFVNGRANPIIEMTTSQRYVLRIVWASAVSAVLSVSLGCSMHVIAYDGVYIRGPPRLVQKVNMVSGMRMDGIVTCESPGTFFLHVNNSVEKEGMSELIQFQVAPPPTAGVNDPTPSPLPPLPTTLNNIVRPKYLWDTSEVIAGATTNSRRHGVLDSSPLGVHHIHFSQNGIPMDKCFHWIGQGKDCSARKIPMGHTHDGTDPYATLDPPSATHPTCPFAPFSGERGLTDPSKYPFVAKTGHLYELWVYGELESDPHPFHMHVNHFQIIGVQVPSLAKDSFQVGDYRDTMPVIEGYTVLRFLADRYDGEIIFHCHNMPHGDRGMMSSFLIQPDTASPSSASAVTAQVVLIVFGAMSVLLMLA